MDHRPPIDPADNISAGTQLVHPRGAVGVLVRVDSHRDRLLAVKRGELSWPDVDIWRKELHRDFEHALAQTKLPERPDYEAANQFLIKARRGAGRGE